MHRNVFATLLLSFPLTSLLAHNTAIVHPGLTDNAVDTLNHPLINQYSDEIRQGSIDEDNLLPDARPCYHAYNPISGLGWCPQPFCLFYFEDIIPDCPVARGAARNLWDRAVRQYHDGNLDGTDGAFHLLGRAMHLLQDMTSPAHVHSDVHIDLPGDFPELEGPDDFEGWGAENFAQIAGLEPFIAGDGTIETFIHDLAVFTYSQSTFPGIIDESNPQPPSTFSSMFPTLTYNDGGLLGDDYWHIDCIGDFENFPYSDDWWPSDGDFVDGRRSDGVRRIDGNFYIENSGGDCGIWSLRPAFWHGKSNSTTLMRLYGDVLYPETVRYCAGLLRKFIDTVGDPAPSCSGGDVALCGSDVGRMSKRYDDMYWRAVGAMCWGNRSTE